MEEIYQTSIPDEESYNAAQYNMPTQESPLPIPQLTPVTAPGNSKKRLTILLILLAVCAVLGMIYFFWLRPLYFNAGGAFGNFRREQNNLRIYRTPETQQAFAGDPRADAASYVLTDASGKKVGQFSYVYQLNLITTVGEDGFLLVGDYSSARGSVGDKMYQAFMDQPYFLISKNGSRALPNMPASMASLAQSDQGNSLRITGIGGEKVAYQYCKNINDVKEGEAPYQCDLRQVDLKTGSEKIIPQPAELNKYKPKLMAFSSNKKTGIFMGFSKEDKEAFNKKVNALTGGGYITEDDPIVKEIYKLTMNPSVIKADLASGKIQSVKRIEVKYNYYNKFWVSPDGEHIIYADGGNGQVCLIDIATGKQSTIKLPSANQASEPWSGETTTYDPLYSPDGNYMAYVTYDSSARKEYMGMIDVRTKNSREITSRTMPEFGKIDTESFANMRWYANNQLEMTYENQNYRVDATKGTLTKLDKTHGLLFGLADGAR